MNMSRILQVEKSMRVHGQLQPVVGRVTGNGVQLIDGHKRFFAAEDLIMETLQCQLLEIDLKQAKVLLLSYNRPHQSMDVWEEAMVLEDLQKIHQLDQQALAHLTGYSRTWVSRRLSLIGKLDESLWVDMQLGVLTSSHARALTKLPRGNQGEVARVITTHQLTSRQSAVLTEAFLRAKDQQDQRRILSHVETVLAPAQEEPDEVLFDARLSDIGNQIIVSLVDIAFDIKGLLASLDQYPMEQFTESERVIITRELGKVLAYAQKLIQVSSPQPHRPKQKQKPKR